MLSLKKKKINLQRLNNRKKKRNNKNGNYKKKSMKINKKDYNN